MAPIITCLAFGLATFAIAMPKKQHTTVSDVGEVMRPFTCVKTVLPTMGPLDQTRTYGHGTKTITPTCEPCHTLTMEMGHGPVVHWATTVTVDVVTETGPCLRTDPWPANQLYVPAKGVHAARPTLPADLPEE